MTLSCWPHYEWQICDTVVIESNAVVLSCHRGLQGKVTVTSRKLMVVSLNFLCCKIRQELYLTISLGGLDEPMPVRCSAQWELDKYQHYCDYYILEGFISAPYITIPNTQNIDPWIYQRP